MYKTNVKSAFGSNIIIHYINNKMNKICTIQFASPSLRGKCGACKGKTRAGARAEGELGVKARRGKRDFLVGHVGEGDCFGGENGSGIEGLGASFLTVKEW